MDFAINFISILFEIFIYAIFIRVLLNLIRINPNNVIVQFLSSVTDPILNIAKKITPRTGVIDFSPLVALIGLEILRYLVLTALTAI